MLVVTSTRMHMPNMITLKVTYASPIVSSAQQVSRKIMYSYIPVHTCTYISSSTSTYIYEYIIRR